MQAASAAVGAPIFAADLLSGANEPEGWLSAHQGANKSQDLQAARVQSLLKSWKRKMRKKGSSLMLGSQLSIQPGPE